VNVPGSGGMRFDDVRASFIEFVKHKNLLGLDVAQYNPDKDSMAAARRSSSIFLVEALSARPRNPCSARQRNLRVAPRSFLSETSA